MMKVKWWQVLATVVLIAMAMVMIQGCASQTCVVVANQTGIGVVAEYNQQTQTPTSKVGYVNSVVGIVPTNRTADNQPGSGIGGGAKDSTNVLFETNFSNFFSFWNDNGIYQRVAIGDLAVCQKGAVAMMSKDNSGNVSAATIDALKGIMAPDPIVSNLKTKLIKLGKDPVKKKLILERLAKYKVMSWDAFIDGRPVELNTTQLQGILDEVSI